MIDGWLHDVRFALRLLRKSPLFTATAALSLAVRVGANTTIFWVASAMLVRPMPGLAEPDRLVDIGRSSRGATFDTVSFPDYTDLRDRPTSFTGIYAHEIEPTPMSLGGEAGAERIYGSVVTANYFSVLGTVPHLGRLLQPDDDNHANPVAVSASISGRDGSGPIPESSDGRSRSTPPRSRSSASPRAVFRGRRSSREICGCR